MYGAKTKSRMFEFDLALQKRSRQFWKQTFGDHGYGFGEMSKKEKSQADNIDEGETEYTFVYRINVEKKKIEVS